MTDLTGGIWRYEILWKGKNILPTKMGEIKRNPDISKKFGSVEGYFFLFLFSFHHGILGKARETNIHPHKAWRSQISFEREHLVLYIRILANERI